jgi:hypothetical protein
MQGSQIHRLAPNFEIQSIYVDFSDSTINRAEIDPKTGFGVVAPILPAHCFLNAGWMMRSNHPTISLRTD